MSLVKSGRKFWLIIALVVIGIAAVVFYFSGSKKQTQAVISKVNLGDFYINVTTSGELEAAKSENILGPSNLREVRIWQVQISDIIAEGSIVDSGQHERSGGRARKTGVAIYQNQIGYFHGHASCA
jgi:multidrug efflux pump subunit AcrA (membrane-fusion protein)